MEGVTGISLDTTVKTITSGSTFQINAIITPADAYDKSITWTSSDSSIVTVDASGMVSAIKGGTITVTATSSNENIKTICKIYVGIPVVGFNIIHDEVDPYQVEVNDIYNDYEVSFVPSEPINQNIIITSSDVSIAQAVLKPWGNYSIIGVGIGSCSITVTSEDGGYTDSFTLEVVEDQTPPVYNDYNFYLSNEIFLALSEALDEDSAENLSNYSISNSNISIISVELRENKYVFLTFDRPLLFNEKFTITVSCIKDLVGNVITDINWEMEYLEPPVALDASKVKISGNTIFGEAGATGLESDLVVIALNSDDQITLENIVGISYVNNNDGSFDPLISLLNEEIVEFQSGEYDLYVCTEITNHSSLITITIP